MKRLYKVEGTCYRDSYFECIILADEMPPKNYCLGGAFISKGYTEEYLDWEDLIIETIQDFEIDDNTKVSSVYSFDITELQGDNGRIKFVAEGCNEDDYLPIVVSFTKWYNDF